MQGWELGTSENPLESAVAETAKYVSKSNDYLIYEDYEIKYIEGDKRKNREKMVPKFDSGINERATYEAKECSS